MLGRGDSEGKRGVTRTVDRCWDQGRLGSWEHRGHSRRRGTHGATSRELSGLDSNRLQQGTNQGL